MESTLNIADVDQGDGQSVQINELTNFKFIVQLWEVRIHINETKEFFKIQSHVEHLPSKFWQLDLWNLIVDISISIFVLD